MIRRGSYICFQGILGAGKTLSMTRLGAQLASQGVPVYANYPTSFARPIESLDHLISIRNAVVMLDELQSIMDSREFGKNVGITQWSVIVRKLGLAILYTTQFLGQVDLRIRHITEYVYVCEPMTPVRGQERTLVNTFRWYGEGGIHLRKYILLHTPSLYSLYDSYDYQVKLTKSGKSASFSAQSIQ